MLSISSLGDAVQWEAITGRRIHAVANMIMRQCVLVTNGNRGYFDTQGQYKRDL